MRADIPSGPVAFAQFKLCNSISISSSLHKILERSVDISRLEYSTQSLSVNGGTDSFQHVEKE